MVAKPRQRTHSPTSRGLCDSRTPKHNQGQRTTEANAQPTPQSAHTKQRTPEFMSSQFRGTCLLGAKPQQCTNETLHAMHNSQLLTHNKLFFCYGGFHLVSRIYETVYVYVCSQSPAPARLGTPPPPPPKPCCPSGHGKNSAEANAWFAF